VLVRSPVNRLAPEKVFESESNVEEAAEVIKPASLFKEERLMEEDATVCTKPIDPV